MTFKQQVDNLEQQRINVYLRSFKSPQPYPWSVPHESISDDPLEDYLLHRTAAELRAAQQRLLRPRTVS